MASVIGRLVEKKLITPPKWMPANMHYETLMGSIAYGVSNDASDCDVYGFAIPPKGVVFPNTVGVIPGFGPQPEKFEQYDQHHVHEPDTSKMYDFAIYNIVKYFDLCAGCNPNMIDSLFTPRRCVLYSSEIGELVRERRHLFLHKGAWHKFKGYAYSQLNKIGGVSKSTAIQKVMDLENELEIDHTTSYDDIIDEMSRRGMSLS